MLIISIRPFCDIMFSGISLGGIQGLWRSSLDIKTLGLVFLPKCSLPLEAITLGKAGASLAYFSRGWFNLIALLTRCKDFIYAAFLNISIFAFTPVKEPILLALLLIDLKVELAYDLRILDVCWGEATLDRIIYSRWSFIYNRSYYKSSNLTILRFMNSELKIRLTYNHRSIFRYKFGLYL